MSLKRGFTNEGDRILDYLEKGIFDAIEKQYLRRFIFAIYLVSRHFKPLLQRLTRLKYYKAAGTDTIVPIMSLGDKLSKMSLRGVDRDPAVDALKQGRLPTLGDVKRSLKLMIKTLVTAIQQMETLPKCRYGNFKLFFNDNTPDDYQPPYFRADDVNSNRWFFTTHRTAEVPESTRIGKLETGWHGVSMKVVSVSSFLPSSTEDNNAPFTGLAARCPPKLTPVEEARLRVEDAELQKEDALNRNVVWDADADEDAPGEDVTDEGIVLARCGADGAMVPIGIRGDEGAMLPIPVQVNANNVVEYGGHRDPTPTHVGYLIAPQGESPLPSLPHLPSLPPSDIRDSSSSVISTQQIDTAVLQAKLRNNGRNRIESNAGGLVSAPISSSVPNTIPEIAMDEDDSRIDCYCGTKADTSLILCEGGCKRWHHIWSDARLELFHDLQDKRLPSKFICFDCRLRRSPEWDFIAQKTHADIIVRFKDLALFRRAIKTFEVYRPATVPQFREKIGCTPTVVSQLLARLEDEGFIVTENATCDDLDSVRADGKKGNKPSRKKGKKVQKELHRTKYVFLQSSKRGQTYRNYFQVDPEAEKRLLGLANGIVGPHLADGKRQVLEMFFLRPAELNLPSSNVLAKSYDSSAQKGIPSETLELDSQTQDSTQDFVTLATAHTEANLKRKAEGDSNTTTKRIKVSVGTAVDLCD
ncbi:hypothetical protein JVU11DRAFT_6434 [Chiua virens]|nr:hypothetical protein JVU11DRAFT_6434 [Chiua virens]